MLKLSPFSGLLLWNPHDLGWTTTSPLPSVNPLPTRLHIRHFFPVSSGISHQSSSWLLGNELILPAHFLALRWSPRIHFSLPWNMLSKYPRLTLSLWFKISEGLAFRIKTPKQEALVIWIWWLLYLLSPCLAPLFLYTGPTALGSLPSQAVHSLVCFATALSHHLSFVAGFTKASEGSSAFNPRQPSACVCLTSKLFTNGK